MGGGGGGGACVHALRERVAVEHTRGAILEVVAVNVVDRSSILFGRVCGRQAEAGGCGAERVQSVC